MNTLVEVPQHDPSLKYLVVLREMMFFVLQRRWVAIRLPRLTVMTSVIFCKLVKDLGCTGIRTPGLWIRIGFLGVLKNNT